ncbi:MAG: hypothetical protein AAF974_02320 [Cyanobacteria bacterium P01_E01_bin.34]
MSSNTAVDRVMREFRARDIGPIEQQKRKRTRLDRTIWQLRSCVKAKHDSW